MSTAELGISLAEMIRQDKVAIISCTGANLEEDIMNLVAHSHYKRVPNYRDLSPQDEWDLLENHYNRVTDTCIPEEEAFRRLQKHIEKIWKDAEAAGERYYPHEYMYKMLLSGVLEQYYEIDPKNSWMLAAAEKNLPIVVEVQTLVNSQVSQGDSGNWMGKRETIGIKNVRLNTILAILEKHVGINLRAADVYVQINGIASNSTDDSIDLAIVMSILSSIKNKTIKQLFGIQKTPIFAGRVTLSGNLRTATNSKERQKASSNLGFDYNPKIENNEEIKKLVNSVIKSSE
jgi:ribosome-binding factor A